jgi:hypothetical protein
MQPSMDNSAEVLQAIQLLEAAVDKATLTVRRAEAVGRVPHLALLEAEVDRLRRELHHYRRLYAAQVAQHLRT